VTARLVFFNLALFGAALWLAGSVGVLLAATGCLLGAWTIANTAPQEGAK
jgi:hypothetical protein